MDDFSKVIIERANAINRKIESKSKLISIYEMLNHGKKNKNYNVIFAVQKIINSCLQCGNYRRAVRYIIIEERLINEFEQRERFMKDEITEYFVKG